MAQEIELRDGYVAFVFSGKVDRASVAGMASTPEHVEALTRTRRVLFDLSAIADFGFDPMALADGMKRLAERGIRLAVVSTNPALFGVGRQIAQYSGVEGTAIAVFASLAEAEAWLVDREKDGRGDRI